MQYLHQQSHGETHGYSPGNGISPMQLSEDPLASEEEADAAVSDDMDEPEAAEPSLDFLRLESKRPTDGDDPYLFDDIGDGLEGELPTFSFGMGDGPRF